MDKFCACLWILLSVDLWQNVLLDVPNEGSCWKPDPPPQIQFDYNWMFEFIAEAKYTPMASEFYYSFLYSLLTGKPANSVSDFEKMCLNVEAGLFLRGTGLAGKQFEMMCDILSLSALQCSSTDTKKSGITLYLTWTHDKKYIMFAACAPGNLKAWTLMSSQKVVDEVTRVKVIEHIKGLGFDPAKARTMNYTGCP